ncbi:amidohydrolase [Melanomma pulvis-pyrius CBS 109.77]|uniref:Amidohydrolase n=1 Tax=Melanomma pulvis-pyrius CBS 109.77 TaxID=1314802 RepID=A0A6A6XDU5_9PLEO|nr:amidohydrolase [Melanomma pulvis-pyrius CBS 109.77]
MSNFTISNARIFDGTQVLKGQDTVTIDVDTGLITDMPTQTGTTIDGTGMTLLPGLWDTHVHLSQSTETSLPLLKAMSASGITTAIECGRMSTSQHADIRARHDLPEIRYAGNFATSTGSIHSKFPFVDHESIVDSVDAATTFVEARVKQGADYIKIVADIPGPSQDVINQLSRGARETGKLSIVHAARSYAFDMALRADPAVNIITHVPMDAPLTADHAASMKEKGIIAVPTLAMEEALCAANFIPNIKFTAAVDSVKALCAAGVPILVGTDSNQSPIACVKHGEAIWREMELLSAAGMTPIEILHAATQLSAESFQVSNRGRIATGLRADLILVEGDPTVDIQAMRKVKNVWKAGREIYSGP